LKRCSAGQIRLGEVQQGLEAQLTKVANQGIKINKLDSHMHLHQPPGIFQTVVEIGKKRQE
jgi:predicted glycoside hydrolase/deacetylase ChbG (UPF0249 family)